MSKGFVITQAGKKLLAELVATRQELNITRVMVGKGELPQGQSPEQFADLIEPVAQATSTIPVAQNGVISFIVEYRNDLNGGLQEGFWLKEFGVFAQDGENEILLYYASLGEYPQYVEAYENGKVNIKKYPVSILVTDDIKVNIAYAALAFVTEERMKEFVEIEALPYLEGVLAESESSILSELNKKADKQTVEQALDTKADAEIIQQALDQKANAQEVQIALDKKADKETVTEELTKKANAETVEQALNQKADIETMQQALDQKANEMEMLQKLSEKADKETVIQQLAVKADKEDVKTELDKKVDKEEIEELLQQQIDGANIALELDKKADKETVAEELAKKADAETMQEELNKKADMETMQVELDQKADNETIQVELAKKTDTEIVQQKLDQKADNETMQEELNKKADTETITAELAKKANVSHSHNYAGSSSAGGVANSAAKLSTARTIDGMPFDGSANIVHFGVCETAADVAAKVVTVPSFSYVDGARIMVLFTKGTTLKQSTTLNVNNLGAKNIIGAYNRWPSNIIFEQGNIVELVYYKGLFIITTANAISLANARSIRVNLASTSSTNFDGSANITPGVTGTLPIANGGTGATTAENARTNLGAFSSSGGTISGNVIINGTVAEGNSNTAATGDYSHAEGYATKANGNYSHTEGVHSTATGYSSHAEGGNTLASGSQSHAEGYNTMANGTYSHVEGSSCYTDGRYGDHASGSASVAASNDTVLFVLSATETTIILDNTMIYDANNTLSNILKRFAANQEILLLNSYYANGSFIKKKIVSVDMTNYKIVIDSAVPTSNFECSLIINPSAKSTSRYYPCYAEGTKCVSIGSHSSHAEGYETKATGSSSHTEGYRTIANNYSHAEGYQTKAEGYYAHAEGYYTTAVDYSHAANYHTKASALYQTAIGKYNKESKVETDKFIIGNGTSDTARSNCLRVTNTSGVYSNSTFKSSGADYAEMFEWLDGNTDKKERTGLFVTLEKDKIRVATPEDDYILGIVSACPSVCGDVHDDTWANMHLTTVFGEPVLEEVEIPERTEEIVTINEEGEEITETIVIEQAHTEIRQKLNTEYDNTKEYIPRSERTEWDAVGILGKLVAIDDGSCEENGWCKVGEGGIATISEQKTRFRVMKRLDQNHIKLLIL